MTEQNISLLAESHTAYGKKSFYRHWLRVMRHAVIIDTDPRVLSALCRRLWQSLHSHVLWTLFQASHPELLSGVILPNERIAIVPRQKNGETHVTETDTISHTLRIPDPHQVYDDDDGQNASSSVYRHLFIANEYLKDLESLWASVQSLKRQIEAVEQDLISSLCLSAPQWPTSTLEMYHAFHSSLTFHGPFSVATAVLPNIRRTLIASPPGSPVPAMLKRVALKAARMGHPVLLLHCGLDPSRIDHIYFPELSWLVSHNLAPHSRAPAPHDNVMDLTDGFGKELTNLSPKIEQFLSLYAHAYNQAWEDFSRLPDSSSPQDDPGDTEFWVQEILNWQPFQKLIQSG